jgi:outer membrane protein OmpA-like peptidoglycan-associated protein
MATAPKDLRREKATELSSRASEISRYILFGTLAVGYGIYSSTNEFSQLVVENHPRLLRSIIILASLGILFDFIQYNAGYRAADAAFMNDKGGHKYNKHSIAYKSWIAAYYLKQGAVVLVCAMIVILSIKMMAEAPAQEKPGRETGYVLFDVGEDEVQEVFHPLMVRLAKSAKSRTAISVEITGLADGTGNPAKNVELSRRRAQRVAQWLVDSGVPASKLRIRGLTAAEAQSVNHQASMGRRAVRVTVNATAE